MGYLVSYFESLRPGSQIDPALLSVLNSVPVITEDGVFQAIAGTAIDSQDSVFLPWVEREISKCSLSEGQDVISTRFGGCYFARVWYMDKSQEAFHIHIGTDVSKDREWNDYVDSRMDVNAIRIFKPTLAGKEAWAIISDKGKCYTIDLTLNLQGNPTTGNIEYASAVFHSITKVEPETDEHIVR